MGEGFLPLLPEQAELLPNGVREKLSQHSGTPWLRCSASNTSKLMNLWEVGDVWCYLCKHVLATEGGKTHLEFTQQNRMVIKLGGPNSQNKSLRARWKPSLLTHVFVEKEPFIKHGKKILENTHSDCYQRLFWCHKSSDILDTRQNEAKHLQWLQLYLRKSPWADTKSN